MSIAVSPGNPSLALGVAGQFTAAGTFTDGSTQDITNAVAWASGTPSVATISGTGVASAVAVGTSAITASLTGVTSPDDTLTVIAPSFVVNTTDDAFGFYSGTTSLREAIAGANVVPGQTITFDSTVFTSAQTITLTLGQLELSNTTGTTTITGPTAGVTVDAGGLSRVFQVDGGVTASISGLTITGGIRLDNGGGLSNYGGTTTLTNCTVSGNYAAVDGGGLYSGNGTTTLTNCTVSGNSAGGNGGGLDNLGTITLTNTNVIGNSASGSGGGLFSYGGTAELTDCTVSGNSANSNGAGVYNSANGAITLNNTALIGNSSTDYGSSGGGLFSAGTAILTDCTVTGNSAGGSRSNGGGGLFNGGIITLTNSVLYGNSAYVGGGLFNNGTAVMTNCTVSGNAAGRSGGGVINNGGGSTLTLTNCAISENSSGEYYGGGLFNYGGTATLTDCTVSGNSAQGFIGTGGGISTGGGFFSAGGTTTLNNCIISGNSAAGSGGGVQSAGSTTLNNCTVSGNTAGGSGGGLYSQASPFANWGQPFTLTLTNSTISGNSASSGGGVGTSGGFGGFGNIVLKAESTTTLTNCTVSGNTATGNGGGLYGFAGGTNTLTNTTVSGNSASSGGGLVANGFVFDGNQYGTNNLINCTVSGNSATDSGGGLVNGSVGTTSLGNTIVAVNTAGTSGPDALGTVVSSGNNLIGETDGSSGWVGSDLTGTIATPLDPGLAPLGDYGGPTQTMALLLNSPAIDAGNNALIPAGVTTDQRGFARIVNGTVDIGAFETNGIIVKGNIYNDQDGNGFHGGSEPGLAGWTVNLLDSSGNLLGSVLTDANGNYKFAGVGLDSSYQVAETVPAGWVQTQPLYPTVYSFTAQSGINLNALDLRQPCRPGPRRLGRDRQRPGRIYRDRIVEQFGRRARWHQPDRPDRATGQGDGHGHLGLHRAVVQRHLRRLRDLRQQEPVLQGCPVHGVRRQQEPGHAVDQREHPGHHGPGRPGPGQLRRRRLAGAGNLLPHRHRAEGRSEQPHVHGQLRGR